jgi:hypothetical protein
MNRVTNDLAIGVVLRFVYHYLSTLCADNSLPALLERYFLGGDTSTLPTCLTDYSARLNL